MLAAIQRRWREWRRPPITWEGVKTIKLKMMVHPASVGQALKELEAEKTKLVRARKRVQKKPNRKKRR